MVTDSREPSRHRGKGQETTPEAQDRQVDLEEQLSEDPDKQPLTQSSDQRIAVEE